VEQAAAVAALAPDPDRAPAVPVDGADLRAVEGANTGPIAKFHPIPFAIGPGEDSSARALEDAKLAALAEFAAGAGHEINNPLATIVGRAQALLKHETDPGRRQSLATIAAQAFRIRDMIGDLMVFARPPAPAPERLLVSEAVSAVVARFQDAARERACRLTFRAESAVFASIDPTQLAIVVSELVRNALDALGPAGGAIQVSVAAATVDGQPYAVTSVADNGSGLSDLDREHLFDPFYSGRAAGRGLGFGLCKCWRIVIGHGGWIDVATTAGSGSTFDVYWPAPLAPNEMMPGAVTLGAVTLAEAEAGERGPGSATDCANG
jgi:signal transduction histidine kinase